MPVWWFGAFWCFGGLLDVATPMNNSILTITELHEYLKIPKQTLYALAQQGRIPAAKVGKHWRFQKAAIDRWLRSQHRQREHQAAGMKGGNGGNGNNN